MNKAFVIAEIGINHNGNFNLAKKLISSAAKTGADAVKFQTYITEKRVDKNSPIFDILKKCELSFSQFSKLKKFSESKKIEFMSTPFDEESFDFLKQEKVKKIKIASFDTVNKKFLKYISKKKSHFIMSVGMSNLKEIKNAVKSLNENKNKISLLHCVSSYPTLEKDTNLSCINHLKSNFPKLEIGYSDHTNDILSSFSARVLGATIIEKHYRINNQMKCVDAPVSINQLQMTNLIKNLRRYETMYGAKILGVRNTEKSTKVFRRYS